MPDEPGSKPPNKNQYKALVEASALGFMFPVAIGLGYGWGWLLDRLFGTSPWLTGIFTVFGIVAAFINLFRLAGRMNNGGG